MQGDIRTETKRNKSAPARPAALSGPPMGSLCLGGRVKKKKKTRQHSANGLRGCADSTQARLQVMRERQQCSPFPHHTRLLGPLEMRQAGKCHPAEPKLRAVRLSEGAGASDDIGCIKVLAALLFHHRTWSALLDCRQKR